MHTDTDVNRSKQIRINTPTHTTRTVAHTDTPKQTCTHRETQVATMSNRFPHYLRSTHFRRPDGDRNPYGSEVSERNRRVKEHGRRSLLRQIHTSLILSVSLLWTDIIRSPFRLISVEVFEGLIQWRS